MNITCITKRLLLGPVIALALPLLANAGCLDKPRLTGVSTAGAEFNSTRLPGVMDKDYTYPTVTELAYIASQGATIIRLPFRWERLQREPFTALDPAELKALQTTVNNASQQGLCVLLDVHNYAKYFGTALSDDKNLQKALLDLWLRIDTAFPDPNTTAFGLMNEPRYISVPEWGALAKTILAKLREANSKHLIFIGGGYWSGLHDWFTPHDGQSSADVFKDVQDPLRRTYLEVHQYADQNFSGTTKQCLLADSFNPRFERITNWANDNHQQLFLGEFGIYPTSDCLETLERFLSLMQSEPWRGFTYWSVGRWWGNYPFVVNTSADIPSPQWAILKKYFYGTNASASKANAPKPPKPLNLQR